MNDEKADFSMAMQSEDKPRGSDEMMNKAKQIVVGYFNRNAFSRKDIKLFTEDLYVVWFCKTLQNWKCLISTDRVDDHYFEVTYDGDKGRAYLDVYLKAENVTVQ